MLSSQQLIVLFFSFPGGLSASWVKLALSGLVRHKATIDIPNYLIKIASNLLSTPLINFFNESIESCIVPDIFKIWKVTPVFKTGAMTDPGNYRPIAVLSPFAKILERLVYNQLRLQEKLFYWQAILELTGNLKMKIDNWQQWSYMQYFSWPN